VHEMLSKNDSFLWSAQRTA